jgi:hypothetical protein
VTPASRPRGHRCSRGGDHRRRTGPAGAVLQALQYARQLNPLSIAALHVAAEPDAADRLASRWARLPLAVPLPETVTILTVRW